MSELKNCTCYKNELERLLNSVKGSFICNEDRVISKSEVVSIAKQIAMTLNKGEVISISLQNSPEWWMITLAGLLAGATVIVYPNEKKKEDIVSENEKYGVKYSFFSEEDVQAFVPSVTMQKQDFSFEGKIVLFTSGTQANPKGVIVEINNYIPNLIATQGRLHMNHQDINTGMSPYSHAMGLMYGSCDFFFGGDFFVCRNQLEFTNFIISGKANIACMQPIYLESMIKLDRFVNAIAKMRYVLVGGAPMSQGAYEFYCKTGAKIVNGYGMTECVAGIAITDSESNNNNDRSLDIMESSIIEISDEGEILVSGPTVCQKYINGDSTVDSDGWYHTRDVGYIRDGRLYVTGRKDNVIVCENGYKISIEGLEDKILKLQGIDECVVEYVQKCLVISVVSVLDVEEIYALLDSNLEYYERPFRVKKVATIEVHNGKKLRKYK